MGEKTEKADTPWSHKKGPAKRELFCDAVAAGISNRGRKGGILESREGGRDLVESPEGGRKGSSNRGRCDILQTKWKWWLSSRRNCGGVQDEGRPGGLGLEGGGGLGREIGDWRSRVK